MSEKILNTRIINKHANLTTAMDGTKGWDESTLQLKKGEIALAKVIDTVVPDGNGGYYTRPTYMMKIGDGVNTFSGLNWLAAPASDVHAWAKKLTAEQVELSDGTNTKTLMQWAEAITLLQSAVGSGGTVSELITAAIEALDVTDTEVGNATDTAYQVVTAVSETDGKISVTRRQLGIKDIAGLKAELDLKLNKDTYDGDKEISDKLIADNAAAIEALNESLESAQETLQGNIDLKADQTALDETNEAVEAAQGAADAAQATADDAKATIGGTYSKDATVAADIAAVKESVTAEAEARVAADEALDGRVTELEETIVGLSGAMHFVGVSTTNPVTVGEVAGVVTIDDEVVTEFAKGDVVIFGNKEYVYNGTAFVEFGDVDDVTSRVSTLEGKVSGLEANSATKTELSNAQETLQENIDKKADQTALDETNEAVEAAQGAADAAQATADDAKATIGGTYSKDATVAADIAAVKESVTGEAELRAEADDDLQGQINDVKATADAAAVKADVDSAFETTNAAIEDAQGDATAALEAIGDGYNKDATIAADIANVKASIQAITEDYLTEKDTYILDCGGAV